MPKSSLSKKKPSTIFLSFSLAVVFSLIPWSYLRNTVGYYDRDYYINYIDISLNRIYWFDFSGFLTKISYEWGWHYFLYYLTSELGLGSDLILFLVSLFVLTISFILISSRKSIYLCLLLLNPLYIDFFYSQIRLSFAIAFIYLSILTFNRNRFLSLLFLLPSFFIHTSSFLFLFIFYSAILLEKNSFITQRVKVSISLLVGCISALVTGPYMSVILSSIEDRRSDYDDLSSPVLYMIYWIGLFIFFMLKYVLKKTESLNYYYFYITLSILTMVVINIFLAGYSSRFIAASLPFFILTLSELRGKQEYFIGVLYVFYTLIIWFFWIT